MHALEPETLSESGIPVWRREQRSRVSIPGPLYRASYLHAFVCGRLEDGRELALVAGTHSRNFPYRDTKSKFDDLLLIIGLDRYRLTGRQISSLGIALGPKDSAAIFYNGRAYTMSGAAVQLDFHFNLFARVYEPRPQGIGFRHLLLGMLWQPALVVGTGSMTIHDDRYRVTHVAGEMERGTLTNFRGKLFQFGYMYESYARPAGSPAAYVEFKTCALHAGPAGMVVRAITRIHPSTEAVTLAGERLAEGDTWGLKPQPDEPIQLSVGHRINLGPATLQRDLVRLGEGERTRYGFRERTEPTP